MSLLDSVIALSDYEWSSILNLKIAALFVSMRSLDILFGKQRKPANDCDVSRSFFCSMEKISVLAAKDELLRAWLWI